MFDSHCHLHDERLRGITSQVVDRAQHAGLHGLLLAGVERDTWSVQDELRRKFGSPNFDIAVAYGVHPQMVPSLSVSQLHDQLVALREAAQGRLVVDGNVLLAPHAIGELGLDAYSEQTRATLMKQEQVFRDQLAVARELDLPIVLHILRTHPAALRVLKTDGIPCAGGVVHSFSGSAELAKEYVALGLHISFAGGITGSHAPRLMAAAQVIPEERLLVETDAPDQTPVPFRPSLCEPAFLSAVIETVAVVRGQTMLAIAQRTEDNARRLFRLPKPSAEPLRIPNQP